MRIFNTKRKPESTSKTLAIPVIQIGKPNSVGNIYTMKSIEDIFEDFDEKNSRIYGSIMKNDETTVSGVTNVKNVTHFVEALLLEEDFVIAVTKFLDTAQGKIAHDILNLGEGIIRPTISGFVDQQTKEIVVRELVSFDILPYNENIIDTLEWINIK